MVQALDEVISRDLPQAFQLLREMNENVQQVAQLVDNMLLRVKRGEISTDKGLSFLEMKYHMLLSYLINLTFVVLRKCSGRMIEGDPAIDRLVEIRTVLEKMRPIDHKLKYQIDKLVKTAATGASIHGDPAQYCANPANLVSLVNESEESESEGAIEKSEETDKTKSIYVPPKLVAVHYDGDETRAEKQQQAFERARKRALNSSVMQELQEEYFDRPAEVMQQDVARATLARRRHYKEEYEESYFTRLPVTKQEYHRARKITTLGTLGDELTHFEDFRALDLHEPGSSGLQGTSKKRKMSKRRTKKGFKKRKLC